MIWDFDPVAFSLLGLPVRWYGISYILGLFLALFIGYRINAKVGLNIAKKDFENLVFGLFICGIIGGRVGEFLFYVPATFWTDPLEILKLWHGGMSIHGGILGALAFGYWWTKKHKISFLQIADVFTIPLAIALIFGRITNFINGELVGMPTDQTWGVVFPHIDELFRHPSQLYEAGKNLVLVAVLSVLFYRGFWKKTGFLFVTFLAGYGILRFLIEYFREPDGMIWIFSTGQVLCLGMILAGLLIAKKQKFWKNILRRF